MNTANAINKIQDFLKYLILHGVSQKSLKYYKSDLVIFLAWAKDKKVSQELIHEYIESIRLITSTSTLNRRISTLKSFSTFMGFKKPVTTWQDKILAKFESKPKVKNTLYKIFFNRPNWYKKYHSYPLASYIHIAILILFTSVSGYALYDQVFYSADRSLAFPAALTRPNRFLSFQGRLTSNVGNPITTATNVVFRLYDASSGGTTLWNSGTCSITPDQDGIFSTLLGSSCGAEIASSVFSENASVWVGVTVSADAEATPRIQIATVAYALNSETLQGFPAGTGTSTIPYINSSGTLVLANASPKLQSTSGTFAVEGLAMTISTPNTSNGVVTINPDGVGTLDLTFEGAAPGLSANGFVNATNANITSGSLYSGTVASAASGYNFINFLSGVSPTSKFSVDSTGLTTVGADLYVSSGISLYNNAVTDDTIEAAKYCTGDGETNCVTDFSTFATGTNYWTRSAGNISPITLNDTISATTSAAVAMTLTQTGAFNALLVEDQASDTTPFVIDQSGFVGMGTASPSYPLHMVGTNGMAIFQSNSTDATSKVMRLGVGNYTNSEEPFITLFGNAVSAGTNALALGGGTALGNAATQISFYTAANATTTTGTQAMFISSAGNIAVGTSTTPNAKFDVAGTASVSGTLTLGDGTTNTLRSPYGPLSFDYKSGANTWGTAMTVDDITGYVGVGTTSPSYALDVQSTSNPIAQFKNTSTVTNFNLDSATTRSSMVLKYSNGTTSGAINGDGTGISIGYGASFATNIALTALTSNGYIGIGDTSPASILTVGNGDLFQVNSSGIISNIDGVAHTIDDVAGNLTLTSNSTAVSIADDLYLSSGLSTYSTAVSDGTVEATKFCTGDGETNCVTDFSSLGGGSSNWQRVAGNLSPLVLNDTISATTSASVALTLTQTGAFNALLVEDQASDTTPFVIDQSGNVGIGKTTANALLDVAGTASVSGTLTLGNGTTNTLRSPYGPLSFDYKSGANTWGTAMTVDDITGYVGVGTTTPEVLMDVFSAGNTAIRSRSNGDTYIDLVADDNADGTNDAVLRFQTGTTWQTAMGYDSSLGMFEINVASSGLDDTPALVVNSSSNVGIGTTGPDARLDVLSATEQLRLTYTDGAIYSAHTLDSSGNLLIDNTGTKTAIADDLQINGGDILDSSGNESIRFGTTASAVNELTVTNAATAGTVTVAATGGDTDVALNLDSKGADALNLNGTATGDVNIAGGSAGTGCTVSNATGNLTCTGIISGAAATSKWNAITAPDGNLTLAHAGNTTAFTFNSVTTATAFDMSSTSLTSGKLFNLASTSTALTTGNLLALDWTPGSATTATGDLFSLNIGANGNVGNLFNIKDAGNSLFSVSETALTSNLPANFTSAGDVSIAYDLLFTNPTSSYVKSTAPLYIQAGETFNSSNLTLQTYNSGNILLDPASGSVAVGTGITPVGKFEVNGKKTGKALSIFNETGDQNVLTASVSGTTKFVINNAGNVAIGSAVADAPLDVTGDVYITDGLSLYETAVSDGTIEATKFCTGDGETNCVTDFSAIGGGAPAWSSITNPTGNLTLSMGTNLTDFSWTTTTEHALTLTAASTTTGSALHIDGPATTGVTGTTSGVFELTSDVGAISSGNLAYLAPDFSSATGAGGTGLNIDGTSTTNVGGTINNLRSQLALTGNGAKFGIALKGTVTSSSTTADTLYGAYLDPSVTGAISTGTRSVSGFYANPTSTAANTGGTTNIYGGSITASSTNSTTGSTSNVYGISVSTTGTLTTDGTINQYGININNGTSSTTGTSAKYGLYINDQTGADTNYSIYSAGGTSYFAGSVGVGTTGPDAKLDSLATTEQLRLTYTDGVTYSSNTVDSSGNLTISNTGTKTVINDDLAATGVLQIGGSTPTTYSRFGTATTAHGGNIASSADVLLEDLEIDGTLFLDGGIIANVAGTTAVSLSATPTTTSNTLSSGNWTIDNTANVGQAALIINNTKAGDLFAASASAVTKASINASGDMNLGYSGVSTPTTTNPLMIYNHGTTNVASIDTAGLLTLSSDAAVNGGDLTTTAATFNLVDAATTLNMGATAVTRTINIGTGTAADTVNIGTGATTANTVNIATGAVANTIAIGSSSATTVSITDNNWSITAAGLITTADDVAVNGGDLSTTAATFNVANAATTLNLGQTNVTRTINLGTGTNADTINIGTGATTANTVNIATGAVANTIAIGSSSATTVSITDNNWSITAAGLITTADDVAVNGGDLTTTAATFNVANAATTLNLGQTNVTRTINLGVGTNVDTINIGTGATGVDVIRLGSGTADLALTDANWSITTAGLLTTTGGITMSGSASNINLGTTNYLSGDGNDEGINIDANGHVGIGVAAEATHQLWVKGAGAGSYAIVAENGADATNALGVAIRAGQFTAGTGGLIDFYDGDGTAQGGISFNAGTVTYAAFTANHETTIPAEFNDSGYPYGTLLCLDSAQQGDEDTGTRAIKYQSSACNSGSYSQKVLGVYAGKTVNENDDLHQVYVLGDGQILVNGQGGNIKVGDKIATSSTIGTGMKANDYGATFGVSQEDYNFSSPDEVKLIAVQYGLGYNIPEFAINETGTATINGNETSGYTANVSGKTVNKIASFAEATVAKLRVGIGSFKKVETNIISPVANADLIIDLQPDDSQSASKLVIKGENNEEVASIDANGSATFAGQVDSEQLIVNSDATISGTLYADVIESERLDEIEALLAEVEGNQALFADAISWSTNTATNSATISDVIASNLFVTGNATVNSLFVAENLTAKSLDSIEGTLSLQSLAINPIEIMAGKIKIDTNGDALFSGNVTVAGNLELGGNFVVAEGIDPSATSSATIIEGQVNSNSTAGKALLPANTTELKIINPKVKLDSLIYVTPVSSTENKVLYVKSKDAGEFVIGFNEPITTDVEFNWWIIELKPLEANNE